MGNGGETGGKEMRLMGLPSVDRYPEATVTRSEEHIEIHFGGKDGEQTMTIPLEYVGGDEEEAELRLLARLKDMGYRVRRGDRADR